jgi:succinate dehydrogenase / fumarate reductase membrane anchor subunit
MRMKPASRWTKGSLLWLMQAASGSMLILVLGVHIVAHHFVVEGGLRTYADVIAYISNPLIFALEVLFLLVVTVHAFLGLRAVLLDLGPTPSVVRILDAFLALGGIATLIYGIGLFVAIQAQG